MKTTVWNAAGFSIRPSLRTAPLRWRWRQGCPRQDAPTHGAQPDARRFGGVCQNLSPHMAARQWRDIEKAMAGGCARPGPQWLPSLGPGARQRQTRSEESISMQRISAHRLICGARHPSRCLDGPTLCHHASEHKNKPPSIRPSALLASPPTVLAPIALSGPLSLQRHPS